LINKDNFPKTLLSLRQWLDWREERCTKAHRLVKAPYSPHSGYTSDATSPKTWGTVDEALAGVEKYKFDGICFAFTAKNGMIAHNAIPPPNAQILRGFLRWQGGFRYFSPRPFSVLFANALAFA